MKAMKALGRAALIALAIASAGACTQLGTRPATSTAATYDSQTQEGNAANWGVGD